MKKSYFQTALFAIVSLLFSTAQGSAFSTLNDVNNVVDLNNGGCSVGLQVLSGSTVARVTIDNLETGSRNVAGGVFFVNGGGFGLATRFL